MMIILRASFFIPEVKTRAMTHLFMACLLFLNNATNFWLIQNCGVIYKTNTAFIRTSPHNFSSNNTIHVYLCNH